MLICILPICICMGSRFICILPILSPSPMGCIGFIGCIGSIAGIAAMLKAAVLEAVAWETATSRISTEAKPDVSGTVVMSPTLVP